MPVRSLSKNKKKRYRNTVYYEMKALDNKIMSVVLY